MPIPHHVAVIGVEQRYSPRNDVQCIHQTLVDLAEFLDHQGDRPVGSSSIAIRLFIGTGNQLGQRVQVDCAGLVGCLGKLSVEKGVHDYDPMPRLLS